MVDLKHQTIRFDCLFCIRHVERIDRQIRINVSSMFFSHWLFASTNERPTTCCSAKEVFTIVCCDHHSVRTFARTSASSRPADSTGILSVPCPCSPVSNQTLPEFITVGIVRRIVTTLRSARMISPPLDPIENVLRVLPWIFLRPLAPFKI